MASCDWKKGEFKSGWGGYVSPQYKRKKEGRRGMEIRIRALMNKKKERGDIHLSSHSSQHEEMRLHV